MCFVQSENVLQANATRNDPKMQGFVGMRRWRAVFHAWKAQHNNTKTKANHSLDSCYYSAFFIFSFSTNWNKPQQRGGNAETNTQAKMLNHS